MTKLIKKEGPRGVLNQEQIKAITSVKNIADSMMEVGQEYTLVIEQVLMDSFGFNEKDLHKFHDNVEHIMTVVREAEGMGMNAVGIRTIRMLSEVAQIRKERKERDNMALLLPKKTDKKIVETLLK